MEQFYQIVCYLAELFLQIVCYLAELFRQVVCYFGGAVLPNSFPFLRDDVKKKGESYLAEQFRQITHYLAEQFRQIAHYLAEHLILTNYISYQ